MAAIARRWLFHYRDALATGPVADFDCAACAMLGRRYAVSVAHGTAALRCAFAASGAGCGDEVIVDDDDDQSVVRLRASTDVGISIQSLMV